MVKISIHYPNHPESRFDSDYHVKVHMPMSIERLGAALLGVSVETGLSGAQPGEAPPFVASCHFLCRTVEDFYDAFLPNAAVLQADMANYTDIGPLIQISQVQFVSPPPA